MKYRSGLEVKIAAQIKAREGRVAYETIRLPYIVPERRTTYTPDFIMSNGIVIEGKGILDLQTRQKMLLVKEQHPDLDIRFVFSNSKTKIYKGSKTTYGDWCKKHNFIYADKTIPEGWFETS